MNIEIKDEILNTAGQPDNAPRYSIRDNNGSIIYDNVQLELKTPLLQEGTPINKELFENFYNNMLISTKETVVDYVVEEDTPQIDIENLDLIADGGFYELIIMGRVDYGSDNVGIGVRINGVSSSYYEKYYSSSSGSHSTCINVGCRGSGGITVCWFGIVDGMLRVTTIGSYGDSYPHYYNYINSTIKNINSVSFILPNASMAGAIKAGTQIILSKRR